MKKITIVDYGSGNVLSAQKSFIKIARDNNIEADVLISYLSSYDEQTVLTCDQKNQCRSIHSHCPNHQDQ